jgi:hypothetical protein
MNGRKPRKIKACFGSRLTESGSRHFFHAESDPDPEPSFCYDNIDTVNMLAIATKIVIQAIPYISTNTSKKDVQAIREPSNPPESSSKRKNMKKLFTSKGTAVL